MSLWPIGVGFALLASASGTAGKLLLRSSELLKNKKKLQRSKLALAGGLTLNTAVGPLLDLVSYAFAPQSLIAPFGGLDIVWNTLAAPVFLGEKTTTPRLCSVALVFSGTFASIFVGPHEEADYTVELLEELLFRWRVFGYLLVFLCWLAINAVLLRRPKGSSWRGFALGATAGTVAGNMFFAKGAAELIESAFVDGSAEAWGTWLPWCLIFGAVFCAVGNLYFISTGMREHEAVFMVTVYEGSMIVSNCLSATVVLGEMDDSEAWRIVAYFSCIGLIICGLVLMLWGESLQRKSERDSSEPGEEASADHCTGIPKLSDCPNTVIIARSVETGIEKVVTKVRSASKDHFATGEKSGSKEVVVSQFQIGLPSPDPSSPISSVTFIEPSTSCVLPPCGSFDPQANISRMISKGAICEGTASLETISDLDHLPGSVPSTPTIRLSTPRSTGSGEADRNQLTSNTLLC